MSKWALIVLLALGAGIVAGFFVRKSVRAEVVISASPSEVWSVLMDTKAYGEWNPILTRVDGEFSEGADLNVQMRISDGDASEVKSHVAQLTPKKLLNQTGGITGILTFNHSWILEEAPSGTRVVQYEYYTGVGVLFWNPAAVKAAYDQANRNLALRLEE